jgi:hypothetical protein
MVIAVVAVLVNVGVPTSGVATAPRIETWYTPGTSATNENSPAGAATS